MNWKKKIKIIIAKNPLISTIRRRRRVSTTVSCRDCDYIPKIENAGEIIEVGENKKYQLMHNGVKVHYGGYHGDMLGKIIKKLKGHHEPQEEKVFYEVLRHIGPEATMLELGSYWSYYSLWFSKEIKKSKNYMIEPDTKKLRLGKINFEINNMKGDFTQASIGKETKKQISFFGDDQYYTVPQITIDGFLKEKGIGDLTILHSDIQGFEYEMLLGASSSLKNGVIKYLFISTHENKIHKRCLALLKKLEYKIIAQHTIRESYSTDGLIVAKLKNIKKPETAKISKRSFLPSIFKKLKI